MSCYAALVTSRSRTAIASIELIGDEAKDIIEQIFSGWAGGANKVGKHHYRHGKIMTDVEIIDEVLLSCASDTNYTIHSHGNPLIVKNILQLLKTKSVDIVDADRLAEIKAEKVLKTDIISIEAMREHPRAQTINGVKLIINQSGPGLKKWTTEAISKMDKISSVKIRHGALMIQQNSEIARMLIDGFRVVLTGPPNSGKSTLLNALAGQQKAIVSDIHGTTRDWVSVKCRLNGFAAEFIDTAGLDPHLAAGGKIDKQSQEVAQELLKKADIVLLVLDGGSDSKVWFEHESLWQSIIKNDTPVLTVLNKSDLGKNETGGLWISAKNNEGIDVVAKKIIENLKLNDIDLTDPICFTDRQIDVIRKLTKEKSKELSQILLMRMLYDMTKV